ncbi:MAG TPA: hypothetical protein VIB00_08160 [Pyrinomonadaceae bacterium]|jgi:hypothetical protein
MSTVNSDQFEGICESVWRDRANVLTARGFLSGEAALVRAVYWRLCKAGVEPTTGIERHGEGQSVSTYQTVVECLLELNARPRFDGRPFLADLVARYRNEIAKTQQRNVN